MVDSDAADKSISKTGDKAEGLGSKLGKGVKTAAVWGLAIGTAAVGAAAGMFKMATSSAETTDRIDKLSQKIGMSRQGFQEMDFIASQSGMSIESLQVGFKTLRGAMEQAEKGTGKGAEAFKSLGVSVKDSSGNLRDQEEVFNEAVNKLQSMEDGTEKAMLATKLFGKSGQEMMPLLNGAAGSMEEMRKQANDLGLVLGDDAIDAGVAFTDTMDQLQRSFGTAVAAIGVEFMPMITKFADFIIANMPTIQAVVQTVFSVLSTAIGIAVGWLSKIVDAVGEVVKSVTGWVKSNSGSMSDLQSMFKDKISTITDFFKSFFELLKKMWDAWGKDILSVLKAAFDLIVPVFKFAFDLIVDVFKVFAALFKGDWEGAWKAVGVLLENAWKNILVVIEKALVLIDKALVLAFKVIETVIKTAMDFILTTVKAVWSLIEKAFDTVLKAIAKATGGDFDKMKAVIKTAMDLILSVIKSVWDYIKGTFTNVLALIKAIVTGDFEGMKNAIKAQMENARDLIKNIWDSVMNFFRGIDLRQIGIDMIRGLINGIGSMATAVVDSISGVVSGAINGAKKLLGIKSPSRVFFGMGEDTDQGFIDGVGSKLKEVANAGKKLAGAVIQPIGDFAMPSVVGMSRAGMGGYSSRQSGSTAQSASVINQVVNIHSPKHLTPSETARLQKRASQELALGW